MMNASTQCLPVYAADSRWMRSDDDGSPGFVFASMKPPRSTPTSFACTPVFTTCQRNSNGPGTFVVASKRKLARRRYPRGLAKSKSSSKIEFVGAAGFEPTTSCSQSRRATNCATPRFPPETGERAQILAEPSGFSQQPCVVCHFFGKKLPRAWAKARNAVARCDKRFFSSRSISDMVRPKDGTKNRGS